MKNDRQSTSFEVEENIELLLGLIFVVAFQFLLGLYAVSLNSLFYAHYGPFYDSMAYDNGLARMQIGAQRDGTLTTLWRTILASTIVYPWALFAPFAKFGIASRAVGVWIQIFAATWMQLTLFFYFLKLRSRTWAESFAFSSTFILIAAAFDSNGGLSDFRMDLLQYLLLVTVMANYLIARELRRFRWWALLGLTTGLLCLGRATSPVYIVPIFVVCATADLIAARKDRRQFLTGWLLAGAVAILVAGWFFIVNYDHLYYYYVIWNPDANAHLPLSKSFAHIKFTVNHIGIPLLTVLVLIALDAATQAFGAFRNGVKGHLNWRPLLFSALPLGYLVASGSGLNPFVSIAGVGGLMIFLLDPIDVSTPSTGMRSRLLAGALVFACGVNAVHGVAKNSSQAPTWILRQEGIRDVLESITSIVSKANQPRVFVFASTYVAVLDQTALFNTMFFDEHLAFSKGGAAMVGRSELVGTKLGSDVATAVEWSKLPGVGDKEKIANVIQSASQNIDFIIAPGIGTEPPQHGYGSRYISEIGRGLLASGQWEQIAGPIKISSAETAIVLRNRGRTAAIQ